jgi:hypothetical protein
MEKNIKVLGLNFKDENYFNYLYSTDNCFVGYVSKLTKEQKELLNAKLIWKREKSKESPVETLEKQLDSYADHNKDKFEMEWDFLKQLIKEAKQQEKKHYKKSTNFC